MGDPNIPRALRSNTTLPNATSSPYRTFSEIRTAILASTDNAELTFSNIPPSIGPSVFDALSEDHSIENLTPRMNYNSLTHTFTARVIPTRIHDVPQMWLSLEMRIMQVSGFLSQEEGQHLLTVVGTTFEGFAYPYVGSRKEPDWAILPNSDTLPSVAAESGWSENWPALIGDMELLLVGGRPNVQLVLLFKWSKRAHNRVAGELRVYERTPAGNTSERLRSSIFPIPGGGLAGIRVTRGELFGVSGVFPGRNAADFWELSLVRLREIAERMIRARGCVPA
ncbi:hypothetical protein ASPVEDRAFT_86122 [Aspergillus versicolor CBS 583.65]|uniref:Uncharacterized protein n=1 Tax=Aspergillus versicolor CBS 583.65 TaxID=1036611 RepID=A0A1L9PT93_ASPVE|nr:uncharacterized protein ASPVEDRAFT_86122 [Aspergillus versicolor CBS 583.65]OJJ04739.1 hypothetical protein ASPVEDRAFT_86122 [Aspergillus versicolor CBS 583.65]